MKRTTMMLAALAIAAYAVPALAMEQGMPAGSESAGTPLNNSVTASGRDPNTGYMPGYRARNQSLRCHYVSIRKVTPSGRVVHRTVRRCG